MLLTKVSAAVTDEGVVRPRNEDACHRDDDLGLYIVCDGMGGHAGGDIAAKTALEAAVAHISETTQHLLDPSVDAPPSEVLTALLGAAVDAACRAVYECARETPSLAGMGTTLTMVLIVDDSAFMDHVGDSRLYLLRAGRLHQLSRDHTVAEELARGSRDDGHSAPPSDRAGSILTRVLGLHPSVEVDSLRVALLPGDRLMLCSDGISDHAEDPVALTGPLGDGDPATCAKRVVDWANDRGGQDNLTAVVVDLQANDSASAAPLLRARTAELVALDASFLFGELAMSAVTAAFQVCESRTLAAHETLLKAGRRNDAMFLIIEGQLAVRLEGRTVAFAEPGDHLAVSHLAAPAAAVADVVAVKRTRIVVLGRPGLERLADTAPRVAGVIYRRLAEAVAGSYGRLRARAAAHGDLRSEHWID